MPYQVHSIPWSHDKIRDSQWNSTDSALRSSRAASPWPSRSSCCPMVFPRFPKMGIKWKFDKNMKPVMVHWWFIFDDSIISIWCSIFPWWFMEPMMIPNIFLHPSNDSWRIVQEKLRVWRLHSPNCLRSSCLFNAFEKIQFPHVCDWGCMYKYIDNDNVKPSISYDNNVCISVYYIKNCKDCIETSQIWFDLDFLTKKTLPAECIRNEVCMDFPCCNCHQSYKSVAVSCAAASSKAPSLAVYHESISL